MEFVGLTSLWLPIVLATVIVFIASALAWTVMPHHRSDWGKVAGEDGIVGAIRNASVPPGHYMFPHAADMNEFKTDAFQQKLNAGPVGLMIVQTADARRNMGKMMAQSFVFYLVVSVAVAYLVGRTVPAGAEYMTIFRVAGTAATLAYTAAMFPDAIWFGRGWGSTWKSVLDGLVYGLLTAGAFAGFWPGA